MHISETNGKYTIYRNGKPFYIKGASGYSHFEKLKLAGGNTLRVWDTTNLSVVLDSAQRHGLAVIAGLPFINNDYISFYQDTSRVRHQYQAFRSVVTRFRNHPALLMWCVGNELDFPYKPQYNSFYDAFNELTDMIHEVDPDHPVTTTILNFNKKYIANIKLRCRIDLISFNIFGSLSDLRSDLKDFAWAWDDPYMLLEWGINGPWDGTSQTAWSAYIEDTSPKKAEILQERYKKYMPVDDPRFLGASVFFWGNKQETTQTWFSMFDENGAESESVAAMRSIWSGVPSKSVYPPIRYMLVDGKGAAESILKLPGEQIVAEVLASSKSTDIQKVIWKIQKEDWYKKNHQNNTKISKAIKTIVQSGGDLRASFNAPLEEGPYRLFAYVYNHRGYFAACNTPFYVVNTP